MNMGVERRFGRPARDEFVTRRRRLRRRWLALSPAAVLLLSWLSASAQTTDSDQDGLSDEWELLYFDGLSQGVAGDPDGDGLFNQAEELLGSDPTRFDTDGDAISDRRERDLGTSPLLTDTDRDGLSDYSEVVFHLSDPLRRDTDGGGRGDGEEVLLDRTNPLDQEDDLQDSDRDGLSNTVEARLGTNAFAADTDGDLLTDAEENPDFNDAHQGDLNENGSYEPGLGEETDPRIADTDADGLGDGLERFFGSDPYASDSDGDGIGDGEEFALRSAETACLSPAQADSDFDGLDDGIEIGAGLAPCRPDTDGDGVLDAVELEIGTDPLVPDAPPDTDGDGLPDDYETDVTDTDPTLADSDDDGVADGEELYPLSDRVVTDPGDADTDDDGLLDGNEANVAGSTSPINADTDGDGLLDGLERGLSAPQVSALDPDATDLDVFTPDLEPGTLTNPELRDSDGDGLDDGIEDENHDGSVSAGETNPGVFDSDADGMDDFWERRYGPDRECPAGTTTFMDATVADGTGDNDGDGLTNVAEYVLEVRLGLQLVRSRTSPCDVDTDDDGLGDSLEAFSVYSKGQTNPNAADTDGDGLGDGLEDSDADGALGATETDPTNADSDADGLGDSSEDADRDGVVDPGETDPRLPDTDDDGVGDGAELLQYGTDPLDQDSDDDGIADGVELGTARDADPTTVTDPRSVDSDGDTIADGDEDEDRNGRRDEGETDPSDYDTDDGGVSDGDELTRGTDPLDPDDDAEPSEPAEPDAGGVPPPSPPDASVPDAAAPPFDDRGTLEPNGEIRGSGLCGMARWQAPPTAWLPIAAALALYLRTRRRGRVVPLGLLGLIGLVAASDPRPAGAQLVDLASARNTNIDANPHRLDPSGYDLLGTSRPRVLSHLGVRAAAVLHHLSGPAVVADRSSGETLRELVGNREEVTLGASLGLFDRAQVSLMLPAVLHQSADLPGQRLDDASSAGLGNLTLVPRVALYEAHGGSLRMGVEAPITLPLWETPAYMGYEGWGIEPRLLGEELVGPVIVSVSFGALLKPDQRIFNLRDGDQLTYALAVQYPEALRDWDFGVEFLGATPLDRPGRSTATRGELLGGARHRFDPRLSVTGGLGAGLFSGIGQPSYRIFVAVGYAFTDAAGQAGQGAFRPECVPQPGQPIPSDCPSNGPDSDGDGVGDATDACPTELEDLDMFNDGDGCPDPDNDGDGVPDGDDGCPMDPEDADGFNDADGCPDPDNDGDGLLDAADRCPLDAEDIDGELDEDGCPDLPYGSELPTTIGGCPDGSVPTPEGDCYTRLEQFDARLATLSESVQFTDRTAELTPTARAILDQVVDFIDQYPDLRMVIVGHTDGRGQDERNTQLSQLRANSVRVYLLRQSKDPRDLGRRIDAIGRGATEPLDTNDTAVGRSRNRRVEFWIVQKLQAQSPAETALPPSAESLPFEAPPEPAIEELTPTEPVPEEPVPEEPAPLEPAPIDG